MALGEGARRSPHFLIGAEKSTHVKLGESMSVVHPRGPTGFKCIPTPGFPFPLQASGGMLYLNNRISPATVFSFESIQTTNLMSLGLSVVLCYIFPMDFQWPAFQQVSLQTHRGRSPSSPPESSSGPGLFHLLTFPPQDTDFHSPFSLLLEIFLCGPFIY